MILIIKNRLDERKEERKEMKQLLGILGLIRDFRGATSCILCTVYEGPG